jgi:hypothetical protein
MTPKRDIQLTVDDSIKFRQSIIRLLIGFCITTFAGTIGTMTTFYFKTTYGMERTNERVDVMEKNYVTRDSYNIVLDQQREIKSDLKEIRNLLISQLK